jgi:hypothetical protein
MKIFYNIFVLILIIGLTFMPIRCQKEGQIQFNPLQENYIHQPQLKNGGDQFPDERDGNAYGSVQISNQCWMEVNMAYLPGFSGSDIGSDVDPYILY